ncbi:branched-chain amino acid ABC transporter permease [Pannonibacter carbonis]|uniref:branched-chain amino acid ABC transporter permease n=1 Tax=Pannonibacter carbonis TaxID=2067569 RepID=UPI000D10055B|nr:branched-chain amino acid ABC transporter permease [Pannonibacter carbonis]
MSILLAFVVSGLGIGAVYALSGVGLVVLYRATGVINFAFGALGALGAFVAWNLIELGHANALAWLAAILVAATGSYAYGRLIAPRLAFRDPVVRSVGTLGFALVLLGFIGWYWGEVPRRLNLPTDKTFFTIFGARLNMTRIIALTLALAMVAAISLLLARTRVGLYLRSLADDRDLSAILGIRVVRLEAFAWGISGVFAGICGLLLANLVRLQGMQLTFLVVPAIAAAILGQLRSLPATAIAGIAIGVTEACLTAVPAIAPYRTAAPFVIALVAVATMRASLLTMDRR